MVKSYITAVAVPLKTEKQRRKAFNRLRIWLETGSSHEECSKDLGFTEWEDYAAFLSEFYEHEASLLRARSTEETYLNYVMEQRRNINDLTELFDLFQSGDSKQHSAAVGAIRARSEIIDKIIDRGQQFGLIEKQPDHTVVSGSVVHRWSDEQLKAKILEELGQVHAMNAKFGQITDVPDFIDVEVKELHLPPPKQKALSSTTMPKGKATAKNRVHGGRRRVRSQEKA